MLLSVIVPIYKTEAFLPKCIDSILAQTLTDLEIVLVDDGSPDNSGRICDEYAAKHPNIQVIHKENAGLTAARQSGVRAAKGKYIAFVDSDDWVDPDFYAPMVQQAEEYNAQLVAGGYISEFSDHRQTYINPVCSGVYTAEALGELCNNAVFSIPHMCQGMAPSVCTKIFRLDAVKELFLSRRDRVSFGEDAMFSYPVLFGASCVVVDNNCCGYHYLQWGSSMTHVYSPKYFDDLFMLYDHLCAAAQPVGSEKLNKSIAYNYIFLFLHGMNMLLSRGNTASLAEKQATLMHLLCDRRTEQALDYVNAGRFGKVESMLRKKQTGLLVARHYTRSLTGRLSRLFHR